MPFAVTVERHPDYVRFNPAGATSLKNFADLVLEMTTQIDKHEDDRVLVDLRKVEGRLSTREQQLLGEVAAARLTLVYKLASLVPRGEVTRNSETAASKAGLQMRVFDSEPAALAWLLDGSPD